jgi:cytochrome P450
VRSRVVGWAASSRRSSFADPYPTYDELLGEPVHWEEELDAWVLTGYAEVAAALADPRVTRGGGSREGDLLTRRPSVGEASGWVGGGELLPKLLPTANFCPQRFNVQAAFRFVD